MMADTAAMSEFRQMKMTSLFRLWDFDQDGLLERSDYVLIALRMAEVAGLLPGSPEYKLIESSFVGSWNRVKALGDADKDDKVSCAEYIAVQTEDLQDRARWQQEVIGLWHLIFSQLDQDHDQRLTLPEFVRIARAYGLDERMAWGVALRFDKDEDGFLPFADLFEYLEDFYFGEDPKSIGTYIAGIFLAKR
jgi:Ca2+-binding EF-hand superfamily protein